DPRMQKFIEIMRGESEEGLRERCRREQEEASRGPGAPSQAPLGWVESAHATTARVVSNDIELDNDERLLYEAIKREIGAADDVSVPAKFGATLNRCIRRSKSELEVLRAEHKSRPLSEREQIEAINARVAEVIR